MLPSKNLGWSSKMNLSSLAFVDQIFFFPHTCVHAWNNHPQNLSLIVNHMWKSTFGSFSFKSWSLMVQNVHMWNCFLNACLNGRWIITSTCWSLEVQFTSTNIKHIYGCCDFIHCTNMLLWIIFQPYHLLVLWQV
jgi:hypothetical protein